MNEQKQPKPILILSLDTETGGFNPRVNALLTVGVATLKLEDHEDISKIEKREWKISNSFRVVKDLPEDALWTNSPTYVEEQALFINKIDLKDLENNGEDRLVVDEKLYKYERQLKFHLSLAGTKKMLSMLDLSKTKEIYLMHLSKEAGDVELMKKVVESTFKIKTKVCLEKGEFYEI